MSVSIALITLNEERNIEACLESISWADEIVMVDSGSTDRTLERAKKFNPKIHRIRFSNFSAQKNAALAKTMGDWIFFIDADERVPESLAEEIKKISRSGPEAAYSVHRETYFFGKRLRFSGTQNDYPIRLFPKDKVRYEQPVHEHIVTDLPVKKLENPLIHHTTQDLSQYQYKLSQYIPLEVEWMRAQPARNPWPHLLLGAPAKFLYLYLVKGGFLDGFTGFQFAMLSAYYHFRKWLIYLQTGSSACLQKSKV